MILFKYAFFNILQIKMWNKEISTLQYPRWKSKEFDTWECLLFNSKDSIPPKPPLTITQIKEELLADSGINLSRYMIVKILKDKLNYSFKKGYSRPIQSTKQELTWFRELFSIKALKYILEDKIIVNIDETCFNRGLKAEYSLVA